MEIDYRAVVIADITEEVTGFFVPQPFHIFREPLLSAVIGFMEFQDFTD